MTIRPISLGLLLLLGCAVSHEPAEDGGPVGDGAAVAECDPFNLDYPTLCHWRRPEAPTCRLTGLCPDDAG